jgi:hypothetical protein
MRNRNHKNRNTRTNNTLTGSEINTMGKRRRGLAWISSLAVAGTLAVGMTLVTTAVPAGAERDERAAAPVVAAHTDAVYQVDQTAARAAADAEVRKLQQERAARLAPIENPRPVPTVAETRAQGAGYWLTPDLFIPEGTEVREIGWPDEPRQAAAPAVDIRTVRGPDFEQMTDTGVRVFVWMEPPADDSGSVEWDITLDYELPPEEERVYSDWVEDPNTGELRGIVDMGEVKIDVTWPYLVYRGAADGTRATFCDVGRIVTETMNSGIPAGWARGGDFSWVSSSNCGGCGGGKFQFNDPPPLGSCSTTDGSNGGVYSTQYQANVPTGQGAIELEFCSVLSDPLFGVDLDIQRFQVPGLATFNLNQPNGSAQTLHFNLTNFSGFFSCEWTADGSGGAFGPSPSWVVDFFTYDHTVADCDGDGVSDVCEPDCNGNGTADDCDGPDCNNNGIPDDCDISGGASNFTFIETIDAGTTVGTAAVLPPGANAIEGTVALPSSDNIDVYELSLPSGLFTATNLVWPNPTSTNSLIRLFDADINLVTECVNCFLVLGNTGQDILTANLTAGTYYLVIIDPTPIPPIGEYSLEFTPAVVGGSLDLNADGIPDECQYPGATVLHVDPAASGAATGLTWTDALPSLSTAQTIGDAYGISDILMAEGTYVGPFPLLGNLRIEGGYASGGGARDPETFTTILSGDVNGDDTPNFGNRGDNIGPVVRFTGPNTILDGVTIRGGEHSFFGAGVRAQSGANGSAIANSVITDNRTTGGASSAGVDVDMTASTDTFDFVNVKFLGNSATGIGGAVFVYQADATFTNCLFQNNTAASGGAIYLRAGHPASVVNSTFVNNDAPQGPAISYAGSLTLRNSIVWSHASPAIYDAGGNATVDTCLIEGGFSGGTNILTADPEFVDAGGGDFRLSVLSPAIEQGLNGALPVDVTDADDDGDTGETIDVDLARNARVVDVEGVPPDGPLIVDLGAFEYQGDCNENDILDTQDIINGTSEDCDGDQIPDECERDQDTIDPFNLTLPDGVINDCDNCVSLANPDQADRDGDGMGDMCDRDYHLLDELVPPAGYINDAADVVTPAGAAYYHVGENKWYISLDAWSLTDAASTAGVIEITRDEGGLRVPQSSYYRLVDTPRLVDPNNTVVSEVIGYRNSPWSGAQGRKENAFDVLIRWNSEVQQNADGDVVDDIEIQAGQFVFDLDPPSNIANGAQIVLQYDAQQDGPLVGFEVLTIVNAAASQSYDPIGRALPVPAASDSDLTVLVTNTADGNPLNPAAWQLNDTSRIWPIQPVDDPFFSLLRAVWYRDSSVGGVQLGAWPTAATAHNTAWPEQFGDGNPDVPDDPNVLPSQLHVIDDGAVPPVGLVDLRIQGQSDTPLHSSIEVMYEESFGGGTAPNAVTTGQYLLVENPGYSVLRFNCLGTNPDCDQVAFEVVASYDRLSAPVYDNNSPYAPVVGTSIEEPAVHDPNTPEWPFGYIHNGLAYAPNIYFPMLEGSPNPDYTGQIVPVNVTPDDRMPDFGEIEVWFFEASRQSLLGDHAAGLHWPHNVKTYDPVWPSTPRELVIASRLGIGPDGVGMGDYGDTAEVYSLGQRDDDLTTQQTTIGWNPNDEHADMLDIGGRDLAFATRDDSPWGYYAGHPWVLVQYRDPNDPNLWTMDVVSVVATDATFPAFDYSSFASVDQNGIVFTTAKAGLPVVPPLFPVNLFVTADPPPCNGFPLPLELTDPNGLFVDKNGVLYLRSNVPGTVRIWEKWNRDNDFECRPWRDFGTDDPNQSTQITYRPSWPPFGDNCAQGEFCAEDYYIGGTRAYKGPSGAPTIESLEVLWDEIGVRVIDPRVRGQHAVRRHAAGPRQAAAPPGGRPRRRTGHLPRRPRLAVGRASVVPRHHERARSAVPAESGSVRRTVTAGSLDRCGWRRSQRRRPGLAVGPVPRAARSELFVHEHAGLHSAPLVQRLCRGRRLHDHRQEQ